MNDRVQLLGHQVEVRSMRVEDVDQLMKWGLHEDPLYADYNFPYLTKSQREEWFRYKTKWFKRCFAVWDPPGNLVGYMALRNNNLLLKKSELGIVFDPFMINLGYGSDALSTLLKWYFDTLGWRKMVLNVAAYNTRAYRMYTKVGFRETGRYFGECFNEEIHPFTDDRLRAVRKFFRTRNARLEVLYYTMEISPVSTKTPGLPVDSVD